MAREYTHGELEEMVVGKAPKANAIFYEKARLMVDASKLAGRRIYEPQTYIKLSHPGVTDVISYRATASDIAKYPEEYEFYMQNRQGIRETVPISIIPNVTLSHMQELTDMGFNDVRKLSEAVTVPSHLEYARQSAITLNRVLQEQKNAFTEESDEEKYEETPVHLAPVSREGSGEIRDVPEAYRSEHDNDVGQKLLQEVQPRSGREPSAGDEESGREHGSKHLNPAIISSNWKVDMVWRQ